MLVQLRTWTRSRCEIPTPALRNQPRELRNAWTPTQRHAPTQPTPRQQSRTYRRTSSSRLTQLAQQCNTPPPWVGPQGHALPTCDMLVYIHGSLHGSLQRHLSDHSFPISHHRMLPIDVSAALGCRNTRERQCWAERDVCPHTCASKGSDLCKYQRLFALPDDAPLTHLFACPWGLRRFTRLSGSGCFATRSSPRRSATSADLGLSGLACTVTSAHWVMNYACCLGARLPKPLARLVPTCFHLAVLCWTSRT